MGTIMDVGEQELMQGGDALSSKLAKSADDKEGPVDWKDDAEEVELRLPLPEGTTKKMLTVKVAPQKLLISGEAERTLLQIDPLFDKVKPDGCNWSIDKGFMYLSLEKAFPTRWGSTLCSATGTLTCWTSQLVQ